MVQDPYKLLGVSPGASDSEVKQAYRKLAKIYHPDVNHAPDAEQKMKDINEAYDMIVNKKTASQGYSGYGQGGYTQNGYGQQGGYTQNGYGRTTYDQRNTSYEDFDPFNIFWGFGGANRSQTRQETGEFAAVKAAVDTGRYQEALRLLSQINVRSARWCYYSALANEGLGNRINATTYAQQAVRMEPANQEYSELLDRLRYGDSSYQSYSQQRNIPIFGGFRSLCTGLCIVNLLLNCCCGGFRC